MAARLNTRQADTAKSHIKVNRIFEELQKHFHGDKEKTATQLRAAEICLMYSMPKPTQDVAIDHDVTIRWKS